MQEHAQVVLFTANAKLASALKHRFSSTSNIVVFCGNALEVTDKYKLDALCITASQASYYGVSQPRTADSSRVFPMPADSRMKGLPRLLISGISLLAGNIYTERFIGRNPAITLATAIAEYNKRNDRRILRVGSIPENLAIDSPDAYDATEALEQAFSDLRVYNGQTPGKRAGTGQRAILS